MFIESQISVIQRNLRVGVDHINDWFKPGIQRCLDFGNRVPGIRKLTLINGVTMRW